VRREDKRLICLIVSPDSFPRRRDEYAQSRVWRAGGQDVGRTGESDTFLEYRLESPWEDSPLIWLQT